jgi:hypothetical protein
VRSGSLLTIGRHKIGAISLTFKSTQLSGSRIRRRTFLKNAKRNRELRPRKPVDLYVEGEFSVTEFACRLVNGWIKLPADRSFMKAVVFRIGLLAFAASAFANSSQQGTYQRTTNGRALVWNNYPKANDRASWSGQTDPRGYATGSGTLSWYKGRMLVSSYSGTMVRGKWNGVVTDEDADGNKFRGTYVNGSKSGDWTQISGRGRYQKTADGQAYVWNNYPKPEDEAAWKGDTDPEGRATGRGTLAWYKNGALVSSYLGTMLEGKWNGFVVNLDADGKKYQGTYADGIKTGDWAEVEEFHIPVTPEQKALNDRWAKYLKEIQADNAYQNWSAPPYDLYVNKK